MADEPNSPKLRTVNKTELDWASCNGCTARVHKEMYELVCRNVHTRLCGKCVRVVFKQLCETLVK